MLQRRREVISGDRFRPIAVDFEAVFISVRHFGEGGVMVAVYI